MASPPPRLCECGCGGTLREHKFPSQQGRFISGHNAKVGRPPEYIEEDRGFFTPCWIWQRSKFTTGYGVIRRKGKQLTAHRVYYEEHKGPIPRNYDLHHLCYQRACVNPAHLEPGAKRGHMILEAEARSPLDWEDVRRIRAVGKLLTQAQLAKAFDVTQPTIGKILRRETWISP